MVLRNCLRVSALVWLGLLTGCATLDKAAQKMDSLVETFEPDPQVFIRQTLIATAASCAQDPGPEMTLANPLCVSLLMRGRELSCLASRLPERPEINRYLAPDGLLNWEICVGEISQALEAGFYMSDREIDRRVLLCDAQILSAPSAKQTGVFSRIFGKKTAPDLGRSLMADYGGMGRNKPVSLLKCEVLLPPSPLPVEVSPVVSEPIQETPTHSDPTTPTENTKGGKVKKPVPRGAGQSQKSRRSTPAAPPAQPGKNQVVPMEGVKDKLDKRGNQA